MITLRPLTDLLHCQECGLRYSLDEVEVTMQDGLGGTNVVRVCPMRAICWFCDRVEQQCDLTGVMPRAVVE